MNIFRKKSVFWYATVLLSAFLTVWGYKIIQNRSVEQIYEVYGTVFKDFLLLGIIFPMFSFIILRKAEKIMSYNRVIQWGSKKNWWYAVMKTNIRTSIFFVTILTVPIGIASLIFLEKLKSPLDYLYIILNFLTYAVLFMMVSLLIMTTKVKWNSDIISVLSVLLAGFLPYGIFMLSGGNFLTLSEIINAQYAFKGTVYLEARNIAVCISIIISLVLGLKLTERYVRKKDFLWK